MLKRFIVEIELKRPYIGRQNLGRLDTKVFWLSNSIVRCFVSYKTTGGKVQNKQTENFRLAKYHDKN